MTAALAATVAPVDPAGTSGPRLRVVPPPRLERDDWVAALRGDGPARDAAVRELHELLLRAARFELNRRRPALRHLQAGDLDDLSVQSADDALVAVLAKLDSFRGESRFTTWAYKFALLEAGVKARRRAWQEREVVLDHDGWRTFAEPRTSPSEDSELRELLGELRDGIATALTPHQRNVLVAICLDGVPIDVLAERLDSTRGALYKTLHDARQKLRAHLAARGLGPDAESEDA
jgi:RNA polymerase sigma-70 factor (ECF subfamily)